MKVSKKERDTPVTSRRKPSCKKHLLIYEKCNLCVCAPILQPTFSFSFCSVCFAKFASEHVIRGPGTHLSKTTDNKPLIKLKLNSTIFRSNVEGCARAPNNNKCRLISAGFLIFYRQISGLVDDGGHQHF